MRSLVSVPRTALALRLLLGCAAACLAASCKEASAPLAPPASAPAPAVADPLLSEPALRPIERLAGQVVDAYGASSGPGLRVSAVGLSDADRDREPWPAVETDAEGRFVLEGPALSFPLRLNAASRARHGTLQVLGPQAAADPRVVTLPLFGRRALLRDQHGQPVRWPSAASVAEALAQDPRLEHLEVEGHLLLDLPPPAGPSGPERVFLATLRAEPGVEPPLLEWRLELPGYEYARLLLELLPLEPDGSVPAQVLTLERSTEGFGELEMQLPAGLVAADRDPRAGGLVLTLESGGRASASSYELHPAPDGRTLLRDVPAGSYRARLTVRGAYLHPPAAEPGPELVLRPDRVLRVDLGGPAWSGVEADIELPDGSLHEGLVHLELRPGWGDPGPGGRGSRSEFRSFPAPPYRFDPVPAGRYTLLVRRLSGLVDPGPTRSPFEAFSEPDLPRLELELRPAERARVRLVPQG